ncbi:protein SOSEKI 2 [Cornus florida]|uniref:protein SOSEKI 2 n=1 Tax=Cornus florida TaxID=4283 RepID=UPI00289DBEFA|nr:protein SOSEKI 2 [Cornus florida]
MNMDVRGRRFRESSPERAKVCVQVQPRTLVKPTFRKVQVVYYLYRNAQLEHPHYMEVTHFSHQPLRLKDVMERLTVLRGKGMPSLYSWSCKRSYKNGYVWNDLADNDIIYASEGDEYVLKGSELVGGTCTEKYPEPQLSNRQRVPDPTLNFHPKRKARAPKRHPEPEEVLNSSNRYEEENVEEEEELEYEEKTSYTSSNASTHSRCSRGVCTDETETEYTLQNEAPKSNPTTELTLDNNSSPPSTTSSILSDKPNETSNNTSKRFEDGDPVASQSRNSVLLQLIACGGSMRGKSVPVVKQQPPCTMAARKSTSLHKGVLCKTTAAAKVVVEEDDEICCMSENPRFGNLLSEEKDYFSGSIVESMMEEQVQVQPVLKKSSSYTEERSSKVGLGEAVEEESKRGKAVKGKCIPRKKFSSKQSMK